MELWLNVAKKTCVHRQVSFSLTPLLSAQTWMIYDLFVSFWVETVCFVTRHQTGVWMPWCKYPGLGARGHSSKDSPTTRLLVHVYQRSKSNSVHWLVLILNTHATWFYTPRGFNTTRAQAPIQARQCRILMASYKYNPMIGQAPKCRHCRVTIAWCVVHAS